MKRILDVKEINVGDIIFIEGYNSTYQARYRAREVAREGRCELAIIGREDDSGYFDRTIDNHTLQICRVYLDTLSLFNRDIKDILG